eukprot:10523956-Alexandrium_andersonii.AAC.1
MSASLVGSEMCIRDRFPPRAGAYAVPWRVRAPPHVPECMSGAQTPCSTAVSYTHLTLPTICSV